MGQNGAVNGIITSLLHQHISQHCNDSALAVRHDVNHIVLCNWLFSDLNNQIRQPLSGKKLIDAVRVGKDGVGEIAAICMQRHKTGGSDGNATGPRAKHVRYIGGCIGKRATTFGKVDIERIFKAVVLKCKRPFTVITQRGLLGFVIFLVGVVRDVGVAAQLSDFVPITLLVSAPLLMRNRLIAPVKGDNGRTSRLTDFLLRLFVVGHDEIFPLVRIQV